MGQWHHHWLLWLLLLLLRWLDWDVARGDLDARRHHARISHHGLHGLVLWIVLVLLRIMHCHRMRMLHRIETRRNGSTLRSGATRSRCRHLRMFLPRQGRVRDRLMSDRLLGHHLMDGGQSWRGRDVAGGHHGVLILMLLWIMHHRLPRVELHHLMMRRFL